MDGHTASWGLSQKIGFTKSVILWVTSSFTYREFFYHHLSPWEHYIPIEADCSNLISTKQYLLDTDGENDETVAAIGERASK